MLSEEECTLFLRLIRHKVFVSYYHRDDQRYRDNFAMLPGNVFINKSVRPGDIDSDLSAEYVKRLIRENYITDSSVVVVLVGPNTKLRKHVDWEIFAGLSRKAGGHSGLIGILLPSFPLHRNPLTGRLEYRLADLPDRLADNVLSGYAEVYLWSELATPHGNLRSALERAFSRRVTHAHMIDNTRLQMQRNRPVQRPRPWPQTLEEILAAVCRREETIRWEKERSLAQHAVRVLFQPDNHSFG